MDTQEARLQMRDLAQDALDVIEGLAPARSVPREERGRLRTIVTEARALLADAGYPGESAWRGIQRASIGAETTFDQPDASYWQDVARELREALETLNSLVSVVRRDTDMHIVG